MISSPKKYQVNGMKIKYPIPKVKNLIDHNSMCSYNCIVAVENNKDTTGPKMIAIQT